jgi:hypothetical protein
MSNYFIFSGRVAEGGGILITVRILGKLVWRVAGMDEEP